jgi:DNA-directed RNA polymerase specialized sigma24 family protein
VNSKIDKYVNDSNVMRIAYSAASSFSMCLSRDEIQSCILNALWRASLKFNKRNKTKFTSYLHNGVVYECLSQRKFNRSRKSTELQESIEDNNDPISEIDMVDTINVKCDDPDLIIDRYYNNMTVSEMAQSRNVCGETIRIRLKKNLEKLQLSLSKSV